MHTIAAILAGWTALSLVASVSVGHFLATGSGNAVKVATERADALGGV